MAVEYDVSDIRRSARKIKSAAQKMKSISQSLNALKGQVPDALQGETGKELTNILNKMKSDTNRMSSGMSGIASRLDNLAYRVAMLDQASASDIRQK